MKLYMPFDVAFGNGYPGHGAYVLPFLRTTRDFIRGEIVPSLDTFL
jgi:hypothetical protein